MHFACLLTWPVIGGSQHPVRHLHEPPEKLRGVRVPGYPRDKLIAQPDHVDLGENSEPNLSSNSTYVPRLATGKK